VVKAGGKAFHCHKEVMMITVSRDSRGGGSVNDAAMHALFSYVYGAQLLGNRCEYFKGLLANGMRESQAGEVVLEDVDVGHASDIITIYIIIRVCRCSQHLTPFYHTATS
jgi:hypothetical protein